MSMRKNKAARLNRYLMFGTFFLGIIVLGCVFAFLYLSFNRDANPLVGQPSGGQAADSILFVVSDSTLLDEN